jgi:hypothetical protein
MIKLGIIGLSEGNGHPYSWSAICNGYNIEAMKTCPFPSIPEYLAQEDWPDARIPNVQVTHIWTQDLSISKKVANASLIPNVVETLEEMIPLVDAILLARDDAENHLIMAMPFLEAGIPIFIDKPLALSTGDAKKMLAAQKYEGQLFSCSSLRFSKDLILSSQEHKEIGSIKYVEACVPKYWNTYAIHVLEPIIAQLPNRGRLLDVTTFKKNGITTAYIEWDNIAANIKVTGNTPSSLFIVFMGENKQIIKQFSDSFYSFKKSIEAFITAVKDKETIVPRAETLEILEIIERGNL